jgi:hypothetical protein
VEAAKGFRCREGRGAAAVFTVWTFGRALAEAAFEALPTFNKKGEVKGTITNIVALQF